MWRKLPEVGAGTLEHLYLYCYIPLITNYVIFFFFTSLRLYIYELVYHSSLTTVVTHMSLGMLITVNYSYSIGYYYTVMVITVIL